MNQPRFDEGRVNDNDLDIARAEAYAINELISGARTNVMHSVAAQEAGRLAVDRLLHERQLNTAKYGPETQDTPELKRLVRIASEKLAERYKCEPGLFIPLSFERDGKPVHAVIYNGAYGLDLGGSELDDSKRSYNGIMAEESNDAHSIEIEGVLYDDREGMTFAAYKALVEFWKLERHTLMLDEAHAIHRTPVFKTLITGEREATARYKKAFVCWVEEEGKPLKSQASDYAWYVHSNEVPLDSGERTRFRPGLEFQLA